MTQAGRSTAYTTVVSELARRCAAGGLDLLQPLQAGWYNDCVGKEHRLADYGDPASLAILVGNTRRLWPDLMATLNRRRDLLDSSDPVDAYVEETVSQAVDALQLDSTVRWAHRPQPKHIAIQQMAEIAGLAWRSPAGLSIHPVYGPWIALRAAVVFPIPGPPARPLPPPACEACPSACLQALNNSSTDSRGWEHQVAVRDACPIGRQYRYPDLQIAYHYGKSRETLGTAVRRYSRDIPR